MNGRELSSTKKQTTIAYVDSSQKCWRIAQLLGKDSEGNVSLLETPNGESRWIFKTNWPSVFELSGSDQPLGSVLGENVSIQSMEKKGKFIVANKDFASEGSLVTKASPYMIVPSEKAVKRICHFCFLTKTSTTYLRCQQCQFSIYCSEKCMNADVFHDCQCSALLKMYSLLPDLDMELIRLCLAILVKKKIQVYCLERGMPIGCYEETYPAMQTLLAHEEQTKTTCFDVQKEMNFLQEICMKELTQDLSKEELFHLILKIKYNSHPLRDIQNKSILGLGIFPAAARMNHSCSPNVEYHFNPETRELEFRSIVPILKGDEICYSYIDLYQTRSCRQKLLQNAYFFDCMCWKCVSPLSETTDRFLNGYVCKTCQGLLTKPKNHHHHHHHHLVCPSCETIVEKKIYKSTKNNLRQAMEEAFTLSLSDPFKASTALFKIRQSHEIRLLHPCHSLRFECTLAQIVFLRSQKNKKSELIQCLQEAIQMWTTCIGNFNSKVKHLKEMLHSSLDTE